MDEENTPIKIEKITKHEFYFETPLYTVIPISKTMKELYEGDVDAYSSVNKIETTYTIYLSTINELKRFISGSGPKIYARFQEITLTCKRRDSDVLRFFIYQDLDAKTITKVGQLPSLADLQFTEIGNRYDKVLLNEDLKNLKKAIGLASHGAGAGSFVYLRRIFEKLIFQSFNDNRDSLSISEDDFLKQRMMEKVETLTDFLPSQLVSMKAIYSILSKGVHELTEDECLRYFSSIKLSIELILDQKVDEFRKAEKDADVKKQLQKIQQEVASSKDYEN